MSHDVIGRRSGRLTIIDTVPKENRIGSADAKRRVQFLCQCDCGNTIIVCQSNFAGGRTKSCGCLRRLNGTDFGENSATHGLTRRNHGENAPRLYYIYAAMKQRCFNPKNANYKNYGGRGITVCNEWADNYKAFHDWAMANGYDETAARGECTLDRIDTDGNYEPGNCRWVSIGEQAKNTRNSFWYKYDHGLLTKEHYIE